MNRIPPQNIEAEQATLGSMLLDEQALQVGLEMLSQSDFYRPVHADVFAALGALAGRNEPVDLISLQEELRSRGKLESSGGTEYLMALVDSVPTAANVRHYAEIVLDKSRRRRVIEVCTALIVSADQPDADVTELFVQKAIEIGQGRSTDIRPVAEVAAEVWRELEDLDSGILPLRVPFGQGHLNRIYDGGAAAGDLVVIGADTSEGKSVVLAQMIEAACRDGIPTLLITCEMSAAQYFKRLLSSGLRMDGKAFKRPPVQWDRLAEGYTSLTNYPLWIRDTAPTMAQLEATARRWAAQYMRDGRGFVVVDYAGLVQRTSSEAQENVETTRIIRRLKALALDLKVVLATASQVRKAPSATRTPGRGVDVFRCEPNEVPFPKLDDLLGSSEIKNSADMCLILYNPPDGECDGEGKRPAFMHNAKYRNGEAGAKLRCWFWPKYGRFDDCEQYEIPDDAPVRAYSDYERTPWATGDTREER